MSEAKVTPEDKGSGEEIKPDTPEDKGTKPADAGSTPAGADTPLDPSIMGGKHKTVGDLVKAATDNQHKAQGIKTDPKPDEEKEDDDDEKPVTRKELNTLEAQRAETTKFDKITSKLGIKGARKEALASFGEKAENREKSWEDMAVELEFATEDRVAKALGQTGDEKGGGLPGKGVKSLEEATTAKEVDEAIDAMDDEEFIEESDKMAGKDGEEKGYEYS